MEWPTDRLKRLWQRIEIGVGWAIMIYAMVLCIVAGIVLTIATGFLIYSYGPQLPRLTANLIILAVTDAPWWGWLLVVLSLWTFWRVGPMRRAFFTWGRLFTQLNHIEAHVRGIPVADVEEEWAAWVRTAEAIRHGSSPLERITASWPLPKKKDRGQAN